MNKGNQKPRIDIYHDGDISLAEKTIALWEAYNKPLLPWQKSIVRRWMAIGEDDKWANQNAGLIVPRQNGKDLAESTDIPTPRGWKKLGDIKVGDYVFGDDGKPTKVIAKYEPEESDFYEIDFGNAGKFVNETVKAGGGHLWEVKIQDWSRPKIVDTNWLYANFERIKSHRQSYSVRLCKPVDYQKKKLPLDPYILGLWLGNGNSGCGQLTCHIDDRAHYERYCSRIGKCIPKVFVGRAYTFKVEGLSAILKANDLIGNKHIPRTYMTASRSQRLELLQGLMDSDGSVGVASSEATFAQSGRPQMVADIMELICSLGMKPSYRVKEMSKIKTSYKDAQEIRFNVVGEPVFKLKRKLDTFAERYTKQQSFNCWYIKDIRKIEKKERYYCLGVDNESHLFLCTRSYIPTHNTETSICRILGGMVFLGEHLTYTAHQSSTVDEIKRRVLRFFYDAEPEIRDLLTSEFDKEPKSFDYIELRNGGRCIFRTRTRSSGLGFTSDTIIVDEAQTMEDSQEEALLPTISAGPQDNPQFLMAGTPPTSGSTGTVFLRARRNLLQGKSDICWQEWSVESITDNHDEEAWYQTNPSLGYFLSIKAVRAEANAMSQDSFNKMRLGWIPGVDAQRVFTDDEWNELAVKEVKLPPDPELVYSVKFAPDRSAVTLAVGVPIGDKIHVEVVERKRMSEGIAWLVRWLLDRWKNCNQIIIDGAAGQGLLIEELLRSEPKMKKRILAPNVKEAGSAYAAFYQAIQEQTLTHYNQPLLNSAIRTAKRRDIGKDGMFGYAPLNPNIQMDPVDAVAFAYYGANRFKGSKKGPSKQTFRAF